MSDPVRVAIDGFNLAIPRGTGVATYARSLSHCLRGLGHPVDALYGMSIGAEADANLRTVQFFEQLQSERAPRLPKYPSLPWARQMLAARQGMAAFEIALTASVVATQVERQLPWFDRLLNVYGLFAIANRYFRNFGRFMTVRVPGPQPAIMHWTYPLPIRLAGAKNIYTVHDLVPLRLPFTTLDDKPTHVRLLTTCLREGDHICTVSDTSRRDILDYFPWLAPERITNTYQSVVPAPGLPADEVVARTLRRAFGLEPRGYFLFFGSIEPKKNIGRLLQAFLTADVALPLVLVGARAWKSEGELALLQNRPAGDQRVRQMEYVGAETLAMLVRGARAVTFPSLYEGFGLPLLEAMALGTPVLASREGSLPEVAGDAALFVDAYDPASIAAGLTRLATDDGLCAELRARGLVRARHFDMAAYQERVAAMYARVLG